MAHLDVSSTHSYRESFRIVKELCATAQSLNAQTVERITADASQIVIKKERMLYDGLLDFLKSETDELSALSQLLRRPACSSLEVKSITLHLGRPQEIYEAFCNRFNLPPYEKGSLPMQLFDAIKNLKNEAEKLEAIYQRGSLVPGTQFVLGAVNTPEQIRSLRNWPEYDLRVESMRPGKLSDAGFLGANEDFIEILLADHEEMRALGVDNVTLGKWLDHLIKDSDNEQRRIRCEMLYGTMGFQESPLPGPIENSSSRGKMVDHQAGFETTGSVSEMHGQMLELWGFCEGRECTFREFDPASFEEEIMAEFREHFGGQEWDDYVAKQSEPQTYRIEPRELIHLYRIDQEVI